MTMDMPESLAFSCEIADHGLCDDVLGGLKAEYSDIRFIDARIARLTKDASTLKLENASEGYRLHWTKAEQTVKSGAIIPQGSEAAVALVNSFREFLA